MYKPLAYHEDLGDVEVIVHQGQLHMFHLVIPNRDLVAHIVSDDGIEWRVLPPAIRTGDPGDCDDDMIRTMSVTERNGRFYMLYTATSRKERGRVERCALAVSEDLLIWTKHPANPVTEASAPYYEAALEGIRNVSWRDPKPFYEDGMYYTVISARDINAPFLRRGCAGLMVSSDLLEWEVQAPLFSPGLYYDLECPQVYKIGSNYYLFASVMEDRTQRYWVSDSLHGPYRTPANNCLMPANSHYAGKVVRFNGKDLFFCWTTAKADGPSPFGLFPYEGHNLRYVPAPLEIVQTEEGRLQLASYGGWSRYRGEQTDPGKMELLPGYANRTTSAIVSGTELSAVEGLGICTLGQQLESFEAGGIIALEAACGGIGFYLDKAGGGYFIELLPGEHKVRLVKLLEVNHPDGYRYFQHTVIRENSLLQVTAGVRQPFLLRAVCGEIEFSLAGKVVLSVITTSKAAGYFGMFAESGTIRLEELYMYKMKQPEYG